MTTTTTTNRSKIIVLDDDPTGSQTVHSCLLLTKWDVPTLKLALAEETSPIFFILTNTRGMSAKEAGEVTRVVCGNIKLALAERDDLNAILVSRSDSTLRGHYPIEPDIIAELLGPFDAHFLVPAFFEGGRVTVNSTHYIIDHATKKLIPCHETEFAKDSVFGYTTAYLPDYVEEKTSGTICSQQVQRFLLEDIRNEKSSANNVNTDADTADGGASVLSERLCNLRKNVCCVVDCENQSDLNQFCTILKSVAAHNNKRFLFRSGASLLTSLAQLPKQPVPAEQMGTKYVRNTSCGGIILVGSHVQKTTAQLTQLLTLPNVHGIEVDVERIRKANQQGNHLDLMLVELMEKVHNIHNNQKEHVVIYTSRDELVSCFGSDEERLEFGKLVSSFLMDIVKRLPETIAFLISKGGITSNDVLSKGLALSTSRVVGQILPGCSVVCCPLNHPRFSELPVVIFPGNVGDEYGLATVLNRLSS